MPAASHIAASAAEHAQMPAAMLVKQAETVPCQRIPPPLGLSLDTEDASTALWPAPPPGLDFNEGREDDEDMGPPTPERVPFDLGTLGHSYFVSVFFFSADFMFEHCFFYVGGFAYIFLYT